MSVEIIRGKRKGEVRELSQWANDWVSLDDGTIMSPTSLMYGQEEKDRIDRDEAKGIWIYEWDGCVLRKPRRVRPR